MEKWLWSHSRFLFLCSVSRFHSYHNSAVSVLRQNKGEEPFSAFLKKYFAANKKFGAKDRKQISHLCYCYFRLGKSLATLSIEEKILAGLFLCSVEPNELLAALKPEWNEQVKQPFESKYSILNNQFLLVDVFPWKDDLSETIDHEEFCHSFFIQPDLFLRLRPGKEELVKKKLEKAGISFVEKKPGCLALPNAAKIDMVIELNREAVVQDYSSQLTGKLLQPIIGNTRLPDGQEKSRISVWDCCAASGGKSIMAYDLNPGIELTVSDVRESILINLKKRFAGAGIKRYQSFAADLSADSPLTIHYSAFDLIICDAPCSGSGTWGRTPEQLFFFKEQKIQQYAALQKKIVANVIPSLKPGGHLLYITCSVFKKENEEVIDHICKNYPLQLKKMEVLKGYDIKADTMFAALLQKPL